MKRNLPFILALVVLLLVFGCSSGGTSVGSHAPDAEFVPVSDTTRKVTLNDMHGKVVLMDFWATWCGPCRQLIPHLQDLNAKYKSKGLEVMGISNEDPATVADFQKSMNVTYPLYLDKDKIAGINYGIDSYPTVLLADREGKVLYFSVGVDPEALDAAVSKALD